jgi:hypothetical protein
MTNKTSTINGIKAHDCGPLCPLHGDPRDTSIVPLPSDEQRRRLESLIATAVKS